MNADPDYRENASRAVYVSGSIDQSLVARITPAIQKLRSSNSPITVYIDSLGGSTYHAQLIYSLLKTPSQDGNISRIITVATGTAASAAADLLASGDYVIAYPHAQILYHGTRRFQEELTSEDASSLAESLKRTNENFAIRLADKCINRVMFQFVMLRSEFSEIRNVNANATDVECFAELLKQRLGLELSELTERAARQVQKYERLFFTALFRLS